MQPPRVRITLRAAMIAVSVVGLSLWAVRWSLRREGYRREAAYHARMEELCAPTAQQIDPRRSVVYGKDYGFAGLADAISIWPDRRVRIGSDPTWIEGDSALIELAAAYDAKSAHHSRLSRSYRRAVRYPWSPAPPELIPHDPP